MKSKFLERSKYFATRYKKPLLYIGGAILIIILSYGGYRYWATSEVRNLNSALSLMDAGSYDEAESKLLKLIKSDPENIRPYLLLAAIKVEKLARSRHRDDDSKEIFIILDGVDKLSRNSESKRLRAMTEFILGKNYTARKYGMEALKIDNNNDKAWSLLGLVAEKELKWEMAEGYYHQSLERDQNNVETMVGLARVLWQQKKEKAAREKVYEAIDKAENRLDKAKALYTSAHFYASDKDFVKAVADFKLSLSLAPDEFASQGEMAQALYYAYIFGLPDYKNQNTLLEALSHSLLSVKLNPAYSYGYYFASKIYSERKMGDISIKYMEFALKYAKQANTDKSFISKIEKELALLKVTKK